LTENTEKFVWQSISCVHFFREESSKTAVTAFHLPNQSTSAATLETLFQTLLHRAFDGSLTAQWREGKAKELLQEMNDQAK